MSANEVDQLLKDQALFDGWELERVGRIQATHSEMFEYHGRSKAGAEQLAVKRVTASSNPGETVSREFKAIQIVWALAGQRLAGLPKPLMVLPEAGLMVTEKVSGIPLSQVLARRTNYVMAVFRAANVCDITRGVGGWLSQFHEATRQPALAHDAKAFDREVTSQLEGCVRRGLGGAAAQDIFRAASRASGLVDGQPLPAAARHGDFTARNILIDGERIGVVDFENFVERDTIYEDLGKFVAYLAMLQGRPGYSRVAVNAAAQCFLRGYGSSVDGKLVSLFALKAAVRMFAFRGTRRMANFFGFDYLYAKQLIRLGAGLTKL
jgi:Phosphotransferase enzyme family